MIRAPAKKATLACFVAAFGIQTTLVYSDQSQDPLSEAALRGRRIWHDNACQVCHQTYGQGGFLGPDLTNAASRVDETRLASLLTVGSGQMPAMHFTESEISAVRAFLDEVDRSGVGRGQLRLGSADAGTTPQAAFEAAVVDAAPSPDAAVGFETFRSGICSACHFPFQVSVVGAPDLSTVVERLDAAEIREVLTAGRPEKGMPPPVPTLSEADIAQVIAYFGWLNQNRSALEGETARRRSGRSVDWSRLPWWEFR